MQDAKFVEKSMGLLILCFFAHPSGFRKNTVKIAHSYDHLLKNFVTSVDNRL